jgi:hypothetical protein
VNAHHVSDRDTILEEESMAILSHALLLEYSGCEPPGSHKVQGGVGTILVQG